MSLPRFSFANSDREYLEATTGGVLQKKVFLQFHKIHRKTPVPESLFNKFAGFLPAQAFMKIKKVP